MNRKAIYYTKVSDPHVASEVVVQMSKQGVRIAFVDCAKRLQNQQRNNDGRNDYPFLCFGDFGGEILVIAANSDFKKSYENRELMYADLDTFMTVCVELSKKKIHEVPLNGNYNAKWEEGSHLITVGCQSIHISCIKRLHDILSVHADKKAYADDGQ